MSEWRSRSIESVAERVAGGPFGSSLGRKHYKIDGVPVIRGAQMGKGRFLSLDDLVYVSPAKADKHQGNIAFPGDLIVTQRGTLGQVAIVPKGYERFLLSQSQMAVRANGDLASVDYLYYALCAPQYREQLSNHGTSSGVPHINLKTLRNFEIPFPLLHEQRCVAAVLSSFDELIEINERRIELLEDLTRSLYREWFVNFRFPGHEEVEMVDSDLGPIPEGWEVHPVGEVADVLGGGTPSKKQPEFWNGDIPWFTPSDLTKSGNRFATASTSSITTLGLERSSAKLFPPESVLMTSRATLGVLAISKTTATVNQGFIVIPASDRFPSTYLFEWLSASRSELESIATGATFKEITKGAFKRFPILVPDAETCNAFGRMTRPIEGAVSSLEAQARHASATRDLLLPRLVTGKIDISEVDLGVLTPVEPE